MPAWPLTAAMFYSGIISLVSSMLFYWLRREWFLQQVPPAHIDGVRFSTGVALFAGLFAIDLSILLGWIELWRAAGVVLPLDDGSARLIGCGWFGDIPITRCKDTYGNIGAILAMVTLGFCWLALQLEADAASEWHLNGRPDGYSFSVNDLYLYLVNLTAQWIHLLFVFDARTPRGKGLESLIDGWLK